MLNWVEIDGGAVDHNIQAFQRRIGPDVALGVVIKSNAYGHGMVQIARLVIDAGAQWIFVNGLHEAIELREAGIEAPIVVLGYIALEELDQVILHRFRCLVYNPETIATLGRLAAEFGQTASVHLKLETGTNRQGVQEADLPHIAHCLREQPHVHLEGLTTHFANIEDTIDHSFAERQLDCFLRMSARIEKFGFQVDMRHTACTAAALLFPETHFDLVRVGMGTYGLWPSRETFVSCRERGEPVLYLQPALSWKTRIAQIKQVPEGEFVGYGCTYRTTRPSRLAVLPLGYFEGYDRRLSSVAHVLVRGRRAPVRGRICMNMAMVDVTDIPDAGVEDEVVLIGTQGEEQITADQLASWCGTIPYEILSRIHPSLPRIVVNHPRVDAVAGPTARGRQIAVKSAHSP